MSRLTEPKIDADMRREAKWAMDHAYSRVHVVGRPVEIAQLWCFILVAAERLGALVGMEAVIAALRATADKLEAAQ